MRCVGTLATFCHRCFGHPGAGAGHESPLQITRLGEPADPGGQQVAGWRLDRAEHLGVDVVLPG